jgi:hypothetical protein
VAMVSVLERKNFFSLEKSIYCKCDTFGMKSAKHLDLVGKFEMKTTQILKRYFKV